MFEGNSVVPMRRREPKPERRLDGPKKSRQPNIEKEAEAAAKRLRAILFRKHDGKLTVSLSEFTLTRLADGVEIPLVERQHELRTNLQEVLERDGLVDPRVVRRRGDRLQIIGLAVELCVESGDIDSFVKRCRVVYRLSAAQVKQQRRALREHELAHQAKRQQRMA